MKERNESQIRQGPPLQESLFDASTYDKPSPPQVTPGPAVNRNVHPIQFQMFYGAQEMKDMITDSGDRGSIGSNASYYGLSSGARADPDVTGEKESMDEMWERKTAESKSDDYTVHGSGVHKSIMDEGFRAHTKVTLNWDDSEDYGEEPEVRLGDAHHRVAAAADIEKTTGRNIWINANHSDPNLRYRTKVYGQKGFR